MNGAPYEKYGDDERLLEEFTQVILSNNPNMSLGDRMKDSVEFFKDGKIDEEDGSIVLAQNAKFINESPEDIKGKLSWYIYDDFKFLHPYRCMKQTIGENKYIIYRFGVSGVPK